MEATDKQVSNGDKANFTSVASGQRKVRAETRKTAKEESRLARATVEALQHT